MLNPIWRRYLRHLSSTLSGGRTPCRAAKDRRADARPLAQARLEELESRLAPASFAVNAQLEINSLDEPDALANAPSPADAVVFFESSVANYQVLRQGLDASTDSVVLDSGGDGLRQMAAFLADRHDLSSIGVVAHGEPGRVALGTGALDGERLGDYARELAVVGSALGSDGELDLWSCAVAAGREGASLVHNLTIATGAGVAASGHLIGSAAQGGNWQLDVQTAGAQGDVPFAEDALGAFDELLIGWSGAASMAIARSHHTATLLGNGKVLVAGGFSRYSGGPLSSAELYDPVSNTWTFASSMTAKRSGTTATLLTNGMVLVTGGYINTDNATAGGDNLSSAELYDPTSNTWSAAGSMAAARSDHTATLLSSGMVLVTGGATPNAELYDPISNTWSAAGSMATVRSRFHTTTLLGNGKVLVTGGQNPLTFRAIASAEIYDPTTGTWSDAGSMAQARLNHTATLLSNGMVLVAGGSDFGNYPSAAELYDPISNTWSTANGMAIARSRPTATLLGNGKVLVAGGAGAPPAGSSSNTFFASAESYDPVSNTWSSSGSMATPRSHFTATLLSNGKVLVAGGYVFQGNGAGLIYIYESSAELFDPGLTTTISTMTTLTATPNASTGGQLVTFTATVGPSPGNLGTVTFIDNTTVRAANVPVADGVAVCQISSLTAGTHPITATYNGATGFAASTSNTVNFVVSAPAAPQLLSVTPNGNIAGLAGDQRSRVASLVVAFDQPVQLDPAALTLALHTNNVSVGNVLQPAGFGSLPTSLGFSTSDKMTWIVTFVGNTDAGADGLGSLKDGVYDFNIDAAKVHPFGAPAITMAANRTTTFHRLFGDTNTPSTPTGGTSGTDYQALVNTGDNLIFRSAFNQPAGGGYQSFLDFNGDGIINTADNLQFRSRFNKALTWRV